MKFSNDVCRQLTCTNEQFKEKIEQSINEEPCHFSIQDLVPAVKGKIEFKGEPDTTYVNEPDFFTTDFETINRAIWEQIWDKKLMIDFGNGKHPYNKTFEFKFIKIVEFKYFNSKNQSYGNEKNWQRCRKRTIYTCQSS